MATARRIFPRVQSTIAYLAAPVAVFLVASAAYRAYQGSFGRAAQELCMALVVAGLFARPRWLMVGRGLGVVGFLGLVALLVTVMVGQVQRAHVRPFEFLAEAGLAILLSAAAYHWSRVRRSDWLLIDPHLYEEF